MKLRVEVGGSEHAVEVGVGDDGPLVVRGGLAEHLLNHVADLRCADRLASYELHVRLKKKEVRMCIQVC